VPPPIGFWPLALAWAYMTPQASGGEAPRTKRGSFRMVGSRWPHTGSPPARQRQRS